MPKTLLILHVVNVYPIYKLNEYYICYIDILISS